MTIWKICLTNSHWSSKCRNTSENIKKKCFYFVSIKKTKTKLDVLSCGLGLRLFNEPQALGLVSAPGRAGRPEAVRDKKPLVQRKVPFVVLVPVLMR